jgi:N-acetylneuraminate synthase
MEMRKQPEIQIGESLISLNGPTYFIADLAANHDGSLERAKRLIDSAARAGADAVKFQHFRAREIVSDRGFKELGRKVDHQASWKKSVYEVYELASIDWSWTPELKSTATDCGVEFMTSPYDFGAVDHIDDYVNAYKIGSGEITWLEIIEYIAQKQKPVILATGASYMADVRKAVEVLERNSSSYAILQCNTNYTGNDDNLSHLNLRVIETFGREFPDSVVGLSDHTHGDVSVLGAIALGARVIEKHFTDDNFRPGPDHGFSMNPSSWLEMVKRARGLESALGDGVKCIQANEELTAVVQRRSLRFNGNLKAGQVLTRDDLRIVRPAPHGSLAPEIFEDLLGKKLATDVSDDQAVELRNFVP